MTVTEASTTSRMTGARKAAILMAVLGEEGASAVFRHLSEDDVQRITEELTSLGSVPIETAQEILEEYYKLALTQEFLAQGGPDYASRLLLKAFGEDGARQLLQRVSRVQQMNVNKVESLQKADPQQLAKFLEGEHPQTLALILGHLESKQAATLLMRLPAEVRAEAVKRLAHLRQFSPEMAEKVSVILNRQLQSLGEQRRRTYSGFKSVAELMNRLEGDVARAILENIEQEEPKLSVEIRGLMFTFEDFLQVPEQSLRELVGQVDKRVLAVALKGASEELRNCIYRTMSSRAVEMMKEEIEVLGPVRGKDVAKAQQEIVGVARKLESEEKLVLKDDGNDEYLV
jgi:flagellar motor switch protein FliG